jgi:hypothetical protein
MSCSSFSCSNACLNISIFLLLSPPTPISQPQTTTTPNKKQNQLTMPIIMQIHQLIAPLRQNPQRILKERNHNEEAANSREVRLDRLAERVQPVLDLAGLLADGVEGRRVVGRVAARRARAGVETRVLALQVVAGGAADGHAGRLSVGSVVVEEGKERLCGCCAAAWEGGREGM